MIPTNSFVNESFVRIMKNETERLWTIGKRKNNKKVEMLMARRKKQNKEKEPYNKEKQKILGHKVRKTKSQNHQYRPYLTSSTIHVSRDKKYQIQLCQVCVINTDPRSKYLRLLRLKHSTQDPQTSQMKEL